MNILLLKGFNNYFNRIVKKYSTLADYKDNSNNYLEFSSINFNPNDGVTTSLIIGGPTQTEGDQVLFWEYNGTPDYLIAYETGDNTDLIRSRWFVLESERTATGQYRVALKRDVIAEHFSEVMQAPCFIEKGNILDITNPLLVNPENSSFNQIKQKETPIIDESGSAWLVGYIQKDLQVKAVHGTMYKDLENTYSYDSLYFKNAISSDDGTLNASIKIIIPASNSIKWLGYSSGFPLDAYYGYTGTFETNNNLLTSLYGNDTSANWAGLNTSLISFPAQSITGNITASKIAERMSNYSSSIPSSVRNSFKNYLNTLVKTTNNLKEVSDLDESQTYSDLISKYDGALITNNNNVYKLQISVDTNVVENVAFCNYNSNAIIGTYFDYYINDLKSYFNNSNFARKTTNPDGNKLRSEINYRAIVIRAIKQDSTASQIDLTLPAASDRITTNDALYDIFAVPYIPEQYAGEKVAKFKDTNGTTRTVKSDAMLFIVQKLMTTLNLGKDTAEAFDLQLLPYCPIMLPENNDLRELDSKSYSIITQGTNNTPIGYILFASQANFTKNINFTVKPEHISNSIQTIEDPTFHTEITNWPNPGDIAKDEEGNPIYYISFPLKCADSWDSTAIANCLTEIPQGLQDDQAPDGIGINVIADNAGNVLIYYSAPRAEGSPDTKTFTGNLSARLNWIYPDTALDLKIKNECDFMRLTSPNWNSMFEFKLSKFNNGIHYFNIDCSYKPTIPYIKINPDYSGLYGSDFNDSTGLILQGDFSLPVLNNAWINYQLNNKNYQAIFNRQVQSLDINNQIAREQHEFSAITGVIGAPITGGVAGAMTGAKAGPYGAIAGAAVGAIGGGVLGAVGAAKDLDWLNRQQIESRSFMIDQYNYNIGNIKALPNSISKSDPLTYNNKIWPILEEFSCTPTEKEIFKEKLHYNGMTIMAIGKLADYSISNDFDRVYLKGQIIRLDTIDDDFHIIDAIYQEVNKGFYIPQEV